MSETLRVPLRLPAVVGTKVTLSRQLAPTARLPPQALETTKSPVAETEEILTADVPVLVNFTVCAALVLPT